MFLLSMGGGNSSYNVIRSLSSILHKNIILNGDLNGNIEPFKIWNINDYKIDDNAVKEHIQDNAYDYYRVSDVHGLYYDITNKSNFLTKDHSYKICNRYIIEFKE